MNLALKLAFLFFVGSISGWVLELFYRNIKNRGNRWINPGFCTGPYVPLYGFGLCICYLIACLEPYSIIADPFLNKLMLFACMAVCATAIEYIAGLLSIKVMKVRLWDYSNCWGNIQGIICPQFSLAWAVLGALYYFLIHPHILNALDWLSRNIAFSFVIGLFFGVFIIDLAHSAQLVSRIKRFAVENNVIMKYESIKVQIRDKQRELAAKYSFFRPFGSEASLNEHLKEMYEAIKKSLEDKK